jgi:outer membrane protein
VARRNRASIAVAWPFTPAVIGIAMLVVAQPFRPPLAANSGELRPGAPEREGGQAGLAAQVAIPTERVTFDEAIQRAIRNNPSVAIAAAGILRAEALLLEARSTTRLQVNGNITTTTLNRGVEFDGQTVTPQSQLAATLDVRYPLYAPARWAQRAQADAARDVAEASADDVRRQTALATADAYLTIIARRRVVEGNIRARESAKAHYDLARQLQEGGTGSRLNELRAQQELSADETLVEAAQLAVYRAQEALGVLLVSDGPVDATDEPLFPIPPDAMAVAALPGAGVEPARSAGADPSQPLLARTDLKLFTAEQQLAERVLRDSSKDRLPFLEGVFQPSSTYPGQLFFPQNTWRFLLQMSVPIFDSGQRQGLKLERQAALDVSRANLARALTTARSEVRAAREAIASSERALASARAGADQAQQVVNIVNVSFRAGAATNIEVIDAERRARDADLAVAIAEDNLRRGRLDLLTALGRFP